MIKETKLTQIVKVFKARIRDEVQNPGNCNRTLQLSFLSDLIKVFEGFESFVNRLFFFAVGPQLLFIKKAIHELLSYLFTAYV